MSDENIVETNEEPSLVDVVAQQHEAISEKAEDEVEVVRDEQGRFAAKQQEEQPEKADAEKETVEEKPSYDLTKLGFNKAEIEKISGLPDEVKEVLAARNDRMLEGLQPLKQKAQIADTFIGALQPYAQYLSTLGVTPDQFISPLIDAEMRLRLGNEQQKTEILQRLAHDYGIDLGKVAQAPFDPRQAQLLQQVEEQNRRLYQLQQSQQAAEGQNVMATIEQWAQDKEHFSELRQDMALLLETGKANDLDQAYSMAARLNDNVFQSIQAKQFEELKRKEAQAANQKARQAISSAVQLKGNSDGSINKPQFNTLADEVAFLAQQHGIA